MKIVIFEKFKDFYQRRLFWSFFKIKHFNELFESFSICLNPKATKIESFCKMLLILLTNDSVKCGLTS